MLKRFACVFARAVLSLNSTLMVNVRVGNCCRMMLQKEKQQREEAERQRKELEEKLQRYEEEFEGARKGMTDICRL